jgi:hypothetical protein
MVIDFYYECDLYLWIVNVNVNVNVIVIVMLIDFYFVVEIQNYFEVDVLM